VFAALTTHLLPCQICAAVVYWHGEAITVHAELTIVAVSTGLMRLAAFLVLATLTALPALIVLNLIILSTPHPAATQTKRLLLHGGLCVHLEH
jgi:hypothetical protein